MAILTELPVNRLSYVDFVKSLAIAFTVVEEKCCGNMKIYPIPIDSVSYLGGFNKYDRDRVSPVGVYVPDEELFGQESAQYLYARCIQSAYHEANHIEFYSTIAEDDTNQSSIFRSLLCYVTRSNPGFYRHNNGHFELENYSHNINEIEAESFGYIMARQHMLLQFPSVDENVIDGIILDIANDKYTETHKHYMFRPERKEFKSWDELLQSIQIARENAYKKSFSYKPARYSEEPLAKVMLHPGFEAHRIDSTLVQKHPYEQMWKFAVLLHQRLPDDVLDFPNIRQMDMSLGAYDVSPFTKRKSLQEQADVAAARIEDTAKHEKSFGLSK